MLSANVIKTKEMIVDYRKRRTEHAPILTDGAVLEQVESFKYITGAKLPAIQDLYTRRCQTKALKMVKDSSQPSHRLHGKRYRSAKSRSKRLLNSFYPLDIRLLNSSSNGYPGPSFTLLLFSVYYLCIVTLTLSTCTYYLNYLD